MIYVYLTVYARQWSVVQTYQGRCVELCGYSLCFRYVYIHMHIYIYICVFLANQLISHAAFFVFPFLFLFLIFFYSLFVEKFERATPANCKLPTTSCWLLAGNWGLPGAVCINNYERFIQKLCASWYLLPLFYTLSNTPPIQHSSLSCQEILLFT